MGIMKDKLIEEQIKADEDFASAVQEENARVSKFYEDSMENKVTHIWSDAVVDNIARKVAEEPMEDLFMPTSEEEFQADLASDDARYLQYCREQQEMYDDPYMNWSGQR